MDKMNDKLLELKELKDSRDTEMAHSHADDILCEALIDLGYIDLVSAYHKVPKWFA